MTVYLGKKNSAAERKGVLILTPAWQVDLWGKSYVADCGELLCVIVAQILVLKRRRVWH